MRPETTLALNGTRHERVRQHLFPGDGLEAAAILLCARTPGPRLRLVVRDAILVPHAACRRRERNAITWPGDFIERDRSGRTGRIGDHPNPLSSRRAFRVLRN